MGTWFGIVNSDRVYGVEYDFAEDNTETSTTATIPPGEQKLRLTTIDLPPGTYGIGWYFKLKTSVNTRPVFANVELDDSDPPISEPSEARVTSYIDLAGYTERVLTGIHTIDVDHWAGSGANRSSIIRDAKIEIKRVK